MKEHEDSKEDLKAQEENEQQNEHLMSRRKALKLLAVGSAAIVGGYYTLKGEDLWGETLPAALQKVENGKMATRKDKTTAKGVSLLGFGCMRFPTKGREIDEEATRQLIDYAYKHGVNYFDTAYPYHGGKSETMIGKILKSYPRASFNLADKMPTWEISSLQKAKDIFQEQLNKCQVTYFDYYLLHALGSKDDFQKKYIDMGVLDYLRGEKKAGRIRHLGFSFHGSADFFDYLVENQQWDFVQIQYNYIDVNDAQQQSGRLLNALAKKKIQAVIMEPLKGGSLATLNKGCVSRLEAKAPGKSAASWALRYAATPANVLTVLSGMSQLDQVVDNVNTMTNFKPISSGENSFLLGIATAYKENRPIGCTTCRYCMPCPYGVAIPDIFMVYNDCVADLDLPNPKGKRDSEYNRKKRKFMGMYNNKITKSAQADHCIACGKCKPKCTQRLDIPREMQRINSLVKELQKK